MPLFDHLAELRRRIAIALLAVALGTLVGFVFGQRIIEVLKAPYGDAPLLLLGPGEGFFIVLKIALATGIVLGMPVILFELWRFVSPGLTSDERRMARPWVPLALLFFVGGVAVAYVVLPFAIAFLSSFGSGDLPLQNAWTADGYFGFVATMFIGFGLVMEYPIVLGAPLEGRDRHQCAAQVVTALRGHPLRDRGGRGHAGRRHHQPLRARVHDVRSLRAFDRARSRRRPLSAR